ncbi:MAG: dipeptide/oligopeptide/nickel ABC transporter permease/ATP-binding protein [Actinobacteria bacterium]|nr:dipeptide/oligopeptide/nickel ABC transporter permease/ATP-binding protein [Actinomycetota bacterium]
MLRRLLHDPAGVVALSLLLVVVVIGIIGPWIAPYDPSHAALSQAFKSPSGQHWLGTDSAGRDIFSRILAGTRGTIVSAAIAIAVAEVVGVTTGLVAGYYGKWMDLLGNWVSNILLSLPAVIVLIASAAALGKAVAISMTVFGVLVSAGVYRLTRSTVRTVRNELYVDAARVSGVRDMSIIGRHILYVVRSPLIIQAAVLAGFAITIQASLEFLGLGQPGSVTWGVMLNEGVTNIYTNTDLVLWPAIAITLTVATFVVLGSALRDALEGRPATPRRRRSRHEPARVLAAHAGVVGSAMSAPTDALLTVRNLGIGYPIAGRDAIRPVVEDVSFHVNPGEVLGIVGESGSGKTQTAFAILGLLPLEARVLSGSVDFAGHQLIKNGDTAPKEISALRGRRIAYIPQEPLSNLDPNFTIGHQLTRPLVKKLGLSKADAKKRALELLDSVGIADAQRVVRSYAHQISGGMAQRVLIAGAISCKPDLLVADEPTTALDVTVQADVLDLLRDLQQQLGMAMLMVTHNFGVVSDICDRVVVMQSGLLVESGDVTTVLRSPREPYTQSLLRAMLHNKPPMTRLTADVD